jgi:predicted nucleic acid-binding protein
MQPAVFADTFYWLALARPRDAWHGQALAWASTHRATQIVTTDEVLVEFLNAMAKGGDVARTYAAATVGDIRIDPSVVVLAQTRADFDAALAHYKARPDKEYSLTDCRSMVAMRAAGITEVLTNDRHFIQEGFRALFP